MISALEEPHINANPLIKINNDANIIKKVAPPEPNIQTDFNSTNRLLLWSRNAIIICSNRASAGGKYNLYDGCRLQMACEIRIYERHLSLQLIEPS